jgi:hypothetical protein
MKEYWKLPMLSLSIFLQKCGSLASLKIVQGKANPCILFLLLGEGKGCVCIPHRSHHLTYGFIARTQSSKPSHVLHMASFLTSWLCTGSQVEELCDPQGSQSPMDSAGYSQDRRQALMSSHWLKRGIKGSLVRESLSFHQILKGIWDPQMGRVTMVRREKLGECPNVGWS